MQSILNRLLEGKRLSDIMMRAIADSSPAVINPLLDRLDMNQRLYRWRPTGDSSGEGSGSLSLNVEVHLQSEWILDAEKVSDALMKYGQVEACYHLAGNREFLLFAAFQSVIHAAGWIREVGEKIEGIASTSSQFLLNQYEEQGFVQVRG